MCFKVNKMYRNVIMLKQNGVSNRIHWHVMVNAHYGLFMYWIVHLSHTSNRSGNCFYQHSLFINELIFLYWSHTISLRIYLIASSIKCMIVKYFVHVNFGEQNKIVLSYSSAGVKYIFAWSLTLNVPVLIKRAMWQYGLKTIDTDRLSRLARWCIVGVYTVLLLHCPTYLHNVVHFIVNFPSSLSFIWWKI